MPYCIKCGAKIADDDRFCTACGTQQFAESDSPVYETPEVEYSGPAIHQPDDTVPYDGRPDEYRASYDEQPDGGREPYTVPAQDYGGTRSYEPEIKPKKESKGPVIIVIAVIIILIALLFVIVAGMLGRAGSSTGTPAVISRLDREDERSLAADISTLVQGNIDVLYLGKADQAYYDVIESTAAQCEADYLSGLETEAEFFANCYDIEYLTDDLKADLVRLYQEIYSYSRYTVGEARKNGDVYEVQVVIYPMDIIQRTVTRVDDGGMDWFFDKYPAEAVEAMTDEEYRVYDKEWAYGLISIVRELLPEMGYGEAQTISVQVVRDTDGFWMISDDSMYEIDEWMIDYS